MSTQPFPFITDGIHGDVPINFFPAADSDRKIVLLPSPGLLELCTLPDCTEVRGMYSWGSYLYALARRGTSSVWWRIDTSGGYSEVATITSTYTGPVWITSNATQICIVDGTPGYVFTPLTGSFAQITDVAFPGASSVDFQDSYGLFSQPLSREWFFSTPNDFTTFDAADFYTKEGKPDQIMGLTSYLREVWLFGKT